MWFTETHFNFLKCADITAESDAREYFFTGNPLQLSGAVFENVAMSIIPADFIPRFATCM